jgi:hypothetical protein
MCCVMGKTSAREASSCPVRLCSWTRSSDSFSIYLISFYLWVNCRRFASSKPRFSRSLIATSISSDSAMGCGASSNNNDMDEDVTKGERLDAPEANNAATKPAKKKKMSKNDAKTLNLSDTILEKPGDVRDYYTFDKVLGKGSFGVVHLVHEITTKQPFACKSINKKKLLTPDDIADVQREVQIMLHLGGHANVVQMYGAFEDKSFIHLIMEVCSGGELFDKISEGGHFSEKVAAEYCRTIVSVVRPPPLPPFATCLDDLSL